MPWLREYHGFGVEHFFLNCQICYFDAQSFSWLVPFMCYSLCSRPENDFAVGTDSKENRICTDEKTTRTSQMCENSRKHCCSEGGGVIEQSLSHFLRISERTAKRIWHTGFHLHPYQIMIGKVKYDIFFLKVDSHLLSIPTDPGKYWRIFCGQKLNNIKRKGREPLVSKGRS